ncbi:putative bifunctional diguanylate cyclase/phosphodiesterase [Klebsiella michiganensis]|uniref:putative bifunctional diguanylate cyclase/phosphodiesterase n=1 Tax=Klebsiella michiganensis TaxID=1134687 RepID=UPI0004E30206|nr:EAL domain-containing protein [Klebsiella michiganensis]ELG9972389.1 EAL domain-containing protein [Klebsiella michiganensis]KFC40307.1 D-glycero-D-manno-heptose 1-phosphate guanosyltransferase [Klebsiella michiganensis]MBZ7576083.1 EAL domain-containing protein [Klebsiella michiganensis]MCW9613050.1 EAL domain-containing protein [Klebsiella michiganensis]MDH1759002.1 EAL domain-containing protein [Klebsiella michiganensis]
MNRILTAIILSLFIVTGYITYLVHERQSELQKLTRYTDSWSVSQIVSEYMRLEARLSAMGLGVKGSDHDEVRLRLEIMMSQIALLQQGDLGKFIGKDPHRKAIVNSLIDLLGRLDKQLDTMTTAQLKLMLQEMSTLDGPLTSLASTSLAQDFNLVNLTHDKIQNLYYIYSAISILLIVLCITLGLLMLKQNNTLRRAHVRMKLLATDLQASKEKLQVQNRRLQYDAYHDSLTGMPNRLSFWQRLQEVVNQVRPYNGSAVVMLFDLDNFKDVNDTQGHDAGDKLLQDLASRLSFFRKTSETLYRLGGDEFALVSHDLTEEMALERAKVIREKISQPYQIYDSLIQIGACIGIVISDGESRTDYLYKCADLALYEAKKEGSGNVQVFRPGLLQRQQENKSFEDDLMQALNKSEFRVYYQPIADTMNGEIYGYEALVRWFHPLRGSVPPTEFIPVAEKIGLINQLGEWVLRTACEAAASWSSPLKVSVNVSPVQLMNNSLTDTVVTILRTTGLDPYRLDLEITESDVFNENTRSLEILSQLRELGVQISIDDFGTGYSSLSRLSYFPFDKIKIDRSFVINIPDQKDDLDIVRLIISMGKSLHMRIVAEGVETEEQLQSLRKLGCDLVQGYLIGKPGPLSSPENK